MIIAHLIYDTCSLLACSMTCRSWYMAAVPHLHHTIATQTYPYPWFPDPEKGWPKPLIRMHKLGLLPFVKLKVPTLSTDSSQGDSAALSNIITPQ